MPPVNDPDDRPTRQFRMPPVSPPHAAPWQGPERRGKLVDTGIWTAKTALVALAMFIIAIVVICGILAWFLAEVIPG